MKRKAVVLWVSLALALTVGGALLAAHRAGGPFRVVLFDGGDEEAAVDVENVAEVTIVFTFNGGGGQPRPSPFWEQRAVDVVVEHDVEFRGHSYSEGERLTSDGKSLVPQSFTRRVWNDLRYAVWRFNQGERDRLWVRAREVDLRGTPREGISPERGKVKLGDLVEVLDRDMDGWINVMDLSSRRRGWVHRLVVTADAAQIERLRDEDSAPALVLWMEASSPEDIVGLTVAGGLVADSNLEIEPQANDCIAFDSAGVQHFPKPTVIHGLTIDEPLADKLYCFAESGGLKIRDPESLL